MIETELSVQEKEHLDYHFSFVRRGISFLFKHGLNESGLFRVPGSSGVLGKLAPKLKAATQKPEILEEISFDDIGDVATAAGVFKMYFREFKEPLLSFDLYDMFCAADSVPDVGTARLDIIRRVLSYLPSVNQQITKLLCHFLYTVSQHADENQMNAHNLAIVFAPNVLRPRESDASTQWLQDMGNTRELVTMMIEQYEYVFDDVQDRTPRPTSISTIKHNNDNTDKNNNNNIDDHSIEKSETSNNNNNNNHQDKDKDDLHNNDNNADPTPSPLSSPQSNDSKTHKKTKSKKKKSKGKFRTINAKDMPPPPTKSAPTIDSPSSKSPSPKSPSKSPFNSPSSGASSRVRSSKFNTVSGRGVKQRMLAQWEAYIQEQNNSSNSQSENNSNNLHHQDNSKKTVKDNNNDNNKSNNNTNNSNNNNKNKNHKNINHSNNNDQQSINNESNKNENNNGLTAHESSLLNAQVQHVKTKKNKSNHPKKNKYSTISGTRLRQSLINIYEDDQSLKKQARPTPSPSTLESQEKKEHIKGELESVSSKKLVKRLTAQLDSFSLDDQKY